MTQLPATIHDHSPAIFLTMKSKYSTLNLNLNKNSSEKIKQN